MRTSLFTDFSSTYYDTMDHGTKEVSFSPSKLADEEQETLVKNLQEFLVEHEYVAASRLRALNRDLGDDPSEGILRLSVVRSLLADFLEQGWQVVVEGDQVRVNQPQLRMFGNETEAQLKQRIRKGFEAVSNRQLAEPVNLEFVRRMEEPREFNGSVVSIGDLIDDGAELAAQLKSAYAAGEASFLSGLDDTIRPEIVPCFEDSRCEYTGLRLQDIWRYFRHTWSLEYKLLPGRTLRLLVRNAARPGHPIIGITMLASPTANLLSRDRWIGWTIDELISGLLNNRWSAEEVGSALFRSLKASIKAIRTDDLIPPSGLNHPKPEHFFELDQIVHRATLGRKSDLEGAAERKLVDIRGMAKDKITNPQWKELSGTSLFRKKRSEQLIPLLRALQTMKSLKFDSEPAAALYEALVDKDGKRAVQTTLNEIKKARLASEVADLTVCGAIAPYNRLIGGKLVTALMASKEVMRIYEERYGGQVSEIASQISGKRVKRPADLSLITTTALYGVGSNQYSSLVMRKAKHSELNSDLVWRKIDSSSGFTVTHVSDETVALMRRLSIKFYGRRRINSVFGEGSSPRTRQIREGLNLIGINNDGVLRQSNQKKVYGIEVIPQAREKLLGFRDLDENSEPNTLSQITMGWARRWLVSRISDGANLKQLSGFEKEEISTDLSNRAKKFGTLEAD